MNLLLVLPILVPLFTAAASLLFWAKQRVRRGLAVVGAAILLGVAVALLVEVRASGIQALQVGGWPPPFGITLVADLFAALMVVLAGVTGLAVAVYSLATVDARRETFGYYPLLHVLLAGVCGAFLTGDIFNLYVWFEVMLIASFVLLALGSERPQLEGAIKYVTLNLIASAVFLMAVGVLYGAAGTLNMADLHSKLQALPVWLVTAMGMSFLVAFGMKAAVFPLFFWLPASYHTPPVAVSAVFAGLLTKVGVYALIRAFTLIFVDDVAWIYELILWISGLTMVTGVLGAMAQNEFRRILSFHIISQIGYMIMGLGLFGVASSPAQAALALAASVFYIAHHIIVKTNLFLVSGAVQRIQGSYDLKSLGGLHATHPGLAALFLVPAMSLAGMPPLSGFFAKLLLLYVGLASGRYWIVAVALVVSLFTLMSMTKIWNEAFWKPRPQADHPEPLRDSSFMRSELMLFAPMIFLAALTVAIGLAAQPVFALAAEAAHQLQNPGEYLQAVGLSQP